MEYPQVIKESLIFSNKESFLYKLSSLKNKRTVIVADFDYTFSLRYFNNTQLYSSYCFLENSSFVTSHNPHFTEELNCIFTNYAHYETDTSIDLEFRKNKVREWFMKSFELYIKQKIPKSEFIHMVKEAYNTNKFFFRKNLKEFIQRLIEYDIPLIIISGGIKEIIEILLREYLQELYTELTKKKLLTILANHFTYDSNNFINGITTPIVYTFNKSTFVFEVVNSYRNVDTVVVLGDHLNDYDSIKEANVPNTIGVGFINVDPSRECDLKEIDKYNKVYDCSILYDGSFNYVNTIIDSLYK